MIGNMAKVAAATNDLKPGDVIGYGDANVLYAQIEAGITPAWYALKIIPGLERQAAAHLIRRRFGIFMPEMHYEPVKSWNSATRSTIVWRGGKLPRKRLMFPGHIFVFVWMSDKNWRRIHAVPGVQGVLSLHSGQEVAFEDHVIDEIRAVETVLSPIELPPEWRSRRKRHGWRAERRAAEEAENAGPMRCSIKGTVKNGAGQWIDAIDALDDAPQNQTLARALGLAS